MSALNQYELSRILGSKMVPMRRARFGNFGLLETTVEALQAQEEWTADEESETRFGYDRDRLVVQAFEDVRDGFSIDVLLWDWEIRDRFVARCRELGLDAGPAVLNRRLVNVRKNRKRYAAHGIEISPTTRKEPKPSIVPRYAAIVEFALVLLRYRYGASIDDILIDPTLSKMYAHLARQRVPSLSSSELCRAALHLRKTRYINKSREAKVLESLDISRLSNAMTEPVALSQIDSSSLPDQPALVEVDEPNRHLYVVRTDGLRPLVAQLVEGTAFEIVKNEFWQPNLDLITFRHVSDPVVAGASLQKWEHLLIREFKPIFNWPISKAAA